MKTPAVPHIAQPPKMRAVAVHPVTVPHAPVAQVHYHAASGGPGNAMARAAAATRQDNVLALDANMRQHQEKQTTDRIASALLNRLQARTK